MTVYGFLHTADAHVPTFTALLADLSPGDTAVHVVDPVLLAAARARGAVDDDLRRRIGARLHELTAGGARRALCTCSTIGAAAERAGAAAGVTVLRVDRPMAEAAVAAGGRIAIVAAVDSTLGPTRALLTEVAGAAGRPIELVDSPCLEAWPTSRPATTTAIWPPWPATC
ncbi:MAG: hypothetical protein ACRDY1_12120 [Acidimicrobiales bacterium]